MPQTDIPAWGGFFLAVLIALVGWIRHVLTRPRLDLEVTLKKSDEFQYPNRIERLNLKLVSSHTTTIERCDIKAFLNLTWKTRFFGMTVASSANLGDFPLPKKLEAADVMHGWLDARTLYEQYENAHGHFQIEVFDTLHKRRPKKLTLRLPEDFKKTLDPRPGTVHTIIVDNLNESRMKAIAESFHKSFELKELRCSFTSDSPHALFEFAHAKVLAIAQVAEIVKQHGAVLKELRVR